MKKLAIMIVLAMVCASIPMAVADNGVNGDLTYCCPNPEEDCAWRDNFSICDIETQVQIAGGSGTGVINDAPVVKAKWEYDLQVQFKLEECQACDCSLPSGCLEAPYNNPEGTEEYWHRDACPCIPGLQVLPRLGKTVNVGYFAVVTDLQGISTIEHVYADVYHPDGQFKYQIELSPLSKQAGLDAWDLVLSCHPTLVTYNDGYFTSSSIPDKDADIEHELSQDLALVYYGEDVISYCQPAGYYTVGVKAIDYFTTWSDYLWNQFWYIPTTAINIDFDKVNYGTAVVSRLQWASGDQNMGTSALPTIQNWGNTPVQLFVWQDDMDFGMTSGVYNVEFDARLGSDGAIKDYVPYQNSVINGVHYKGVKYGKLGLCQLDKVDFSIHVKKADPGDVYTGEMCLLGYRDANPVWETPSNFVQDAPGSNTPQDIYDPNPGQAGPGGCSNGD